MTEFTSFFVIIFAGLLFSEAFNRLHLPWVVALILVGIGLGPGGLGMVQSNEVVEFFAEVGLIFLMFMAGLEINFSSFKNIKRKAAILTIVGTLVPFAVALLIGSIFKLGGAVTFLLAAALISSSIGVIVPSLETYHLFKKPLGKTIIAATVVLDVVSVALFSVFVQQNVRDGLPLLVVYVFLTLALIMLRLAIPKIEAYFSASDRGRFEQELRLIISVLVGTAVLFGLLGLHPVEGGFFAGLVLSDSVKSMLTRAKLHAISYGLFIPVFFVVVGMRIDLGSLMDSWRPAGLILAVVVGSITAKFVSGWLGGRIAGFNARESTLIGVSMMPQLSVPLAIAFTAFGFGIIDQTILTALIALGIATTLLGPLAMSRVAARVEN